MSFFGNRRLLWSEQGAALPLALAVSLVLMLGCLAVLKGGLHSRALIQRLADRQQAFYAAESGIEMALHDIAETQTPIILRLPMHKTYVLWDSVQAEVQVQAWGGFLRVRSHVTCRGFTRQVTALAGAPCGPEFDGAIRMGTSPYPLVLTGKTRIVGDVTVGRKGVERGRIQGKGFEGDTLVHGEIKKTMLLKMPAWKDDLLRFSLDKFREEFKGDVADWVLQGDQRFAPEDLQLYRDQSVFVEGSVEICGVAHDTVLALPRTISCSGALMLQNLHLVPRFFAFLSDSLMTLDDVTSDGFGLFYADSTLTLSGQTRFSAQCFSPNAIVLTDSVDLLYPSLVYCGCVQRGESFEGEIVLKDHSVVRGMALCHAMKDREQKMRQNVHLTLSSRSRVVGICYNTGYTTLEGEVVGSVATGAFGLTVAPTYYINWLRDAKVRRPDLPAAFHMPIGFTADQRFETVVMLEERGSPSPKESDETLYE